MKLIYLFSLNNVFVFIDVPIVQTAVFLVTLFCVLLYPVMDNKSSLTLLRNKTKVSLNPQICKKKNKSLENMNCESILNTNAV